MSLNPRERRSFEIFVSVFDEWINGIETTSRFINVTNMFIETIKHFDNVGSGTSGVTCGHCGERHSIEQVKACRVEVPLQLEKKAAAAKAWLKEIIGDD